jgi:hypothetical protein
MAPSPPQRRMKRAAKTKMGIVAGGEVELLWRA